MIFKIQSRKTRLLARSLARSVQKGKEQKKDDVQTPRAFLG